ncbi:transcriptional regulator, TetR family [Bifidobacterium reuteri DSM 23975]|uniref:Transcriptional regulator, TetR family n=1 Tax=Bifidobacterium reuteri DSM 23975 TaxID=1437610 RepID=A0A087CYF5_9BIFI|nr:transcriptional regulator, TetR family [Bifidobacterium reuteri DSM 23975]
MKTISGTAITAKPVSKSPVIPMAAPSVAPRAERRREATDRKLMHATLQIAVERGISGVTIEEVARRSGVAKTTIYRRYHNSNELLRSISAMYLVSGEAGPVPSPTREHFTQLLQRLVDWVRDNNIDVKHVGIVLSSEAEFFHHIVDQVITPWLKQVRTFIGQGVAQGIFRPGIDERLLLSTIIGSLVAYEPSWAPAAQTVQAPMRARTTSQTQTVRKPAQTQVLMQAQVQTVRKPAQTQTVRKPAQTRIRILSRRTAVWPTARLAVWPAALIAMLQPVLIALRATTAGWV